MKKYDIAILGAGASGCMCALQTNEKNSVVLIDKTSLPAKKLQATGNGRCNLTNSKITPSINFYNQDIDRFFKRHSQSDTLDFFSSLGLVHYADEEGRIYPFSGYAKSLIDTIGNALSQKKNISLAMGEEILSVEKDGEFFIITTSLNTYQVKKVVVALGGKANEGIIDAFNIKHRDFIPSLCALKTQNTKLLSGTRISPVKATALYNNKKIAEERGEVLFKDSGLSGIAIFNLSSAFARKGKFEGNIALDLTPDLSKEQLFKLLKERKTLPLPISKFFEGFLPNPVAYFILNKCKFDENKLCKELTDKQLLQMVDLIKNLVFEVKDCYDNNQVFSGGVLLSSLDDNLQSKQVQNLYFTGEGVDVDGICGGFNLQWAWTSGYIVGKSL